MDRLTTEVLSRYESGVNPRRAPAVLCLLALAATAVAQAPVVYTIKVPEPTEHYALIHVDVPTGKQPTIDLWMAVWSPGFYHVENHWKQVEGLTARGPDGKELAIDKPKENHWRVTTGGVEKIAVDYRVNGGSRSVTGDLIGPEYGIFNGCASYVTWQQAAMLPQEVHIEMPAAWADTATGLEPSKDGKPHHYTAPDYDTLVDSPIVAGALQRFPFEAGGSQHVLVDFGDVGKWDGAVAAAKLQPIVAEHARFFGKLPFRRYMFLNVFGPGGGGLEHKNSTLISADKRGAPDNLEWLGFVSHEYFHAFNVKRLRPIELGPFDYENPPKTASLWIAEGLTTYFGDLAVVRSGVGNQANWLQRISSHIRDLQTTPGRLVMTLEQASLDVFTIPWMSGVMGNRAKVVSYYVKGPVVGLLLDAMIRRATDETKSIDDVMRLAYQRYGGERGYKPEEWQATAAEVAGIDLKPFFQKALTSTDELDYTPALEWFGLRFAATDEGERAKRWLLEVRPDATPAQTAHLQHLLAPTPASK
jgi:predicted metalloprotease with PDZ domain